MLAASRAISPRIQPPSQERTGILPSAIIFFPETSPTGQSLFVLSIWIEKFDAGPFMTASFYDILSIRRKVHRKGYTVSFNEQKARAFIPKGRASHQIRVCYTPFPASDQDLFISDETVEKP